MVRACFLLSSLAFVSCSVCTSAVELSSCKLWCMHANVSHCAFMLLQTAVHACSWDLWCMNASVSCCACMFLQAGVYACFFPAVQSSSVLLTFAPVSCGACILLSATFSSIVLFAGSEHCVLQHQYHSWWIPPPGCYRYVCLLQQLLIHCFVVFPHQHDLAVWAWHVHVCLTHTVASLIAVAPAPFYLDASLTRLQCV